MRTMKFMNGKRMLFAALIILTAVLLCSCVMVRARLDIRSDGGAGVDVIYALDQSYLPLVQEQIGSDPFVALKSEMTDRGLTVTDYKNGQYAGIEGKTDLNDAEKVTKLGKSMSIFNDLKIAVDKDNGKIEVAGKVDLRKVAEKMGASTLADTATALQAGDTTLTISFPAPVADHNADKMDDGGKILKWTLKTDTVNEIYASTQLAEGSVGSWPWIAIGIVGVLAVVVVLLLVIRKRKKTNDYL